MAADLDAARRGDARAFGRLVATRQDQIYCLSYRILGDEQAALDAGRAAIRQAQRHVAALPASGFELWLLRWVVTACQDGSRPASAGNQSVETAAAQAMQASLGRLPLELRLALVLVDVAGLEYAQAAAVLDTSHEQVGRRVAEARALLSTRGPRL